jgi:hypothetical protein
MVENTPVAADHPAKSSTNVCVCPNPGTAHNPRAATPNKHKVPRIISVLLDMLKFSK